MPKLSIGMVLEKMSLKIPFNDKKKMTWVRMRKCEIFGFYDHKMKSKRIVLECFALHREKFCFLIRRKKGIINSLSLNLKYARATRYAIFLDFYDVINSNRYALFFKIFTLRRIEIFLPFRRDK